MEEKTLGAQGNTNLRSWAFTSFDVEEPVFDDKQMKYMIYGREVCPSTGKEHWQGFIYFYNKKTLRTIKRQVSDKWHFSACRGTTAENIAYCSKDGKFTEHGDRPQKGKRTDLLVIKEDIMSGKRVETMMLEDPMLYHQYGRTLDKIEDVYNRTKFRTEMTQGIWYYGPTGCGKSHAAFEGYSNETHYNLINDNGWWDGYRGQETVIINDFRGWIPYDVLLQLVDKYPMSVKRRGREPLPFVSKRVIITSSLSPEECYHNRDDNDSIEQLKRRFKIIECVSNAIHISR